LSATIAFNGGNYRVQADRVLSNRNVLRDLIEHVISIRGACLAHIESKVTLACECAEASCVSRISLVPADYERFRTRGEHYVVASGHALLGPAEVVVRGCGYEIIRPRNN
jgi:hypothetical protein